MARESKQSLRRRVEQLIDRFRKTYPDAHCELDYANPLQLLIATILSAQCSDKQVNIVTKELFQQYKTARDFAEAQLEEMEQRIRRIGLYRNKAKAIKAACQCLVDQHRGQVPRSMEELTALDGVGRKTANVVLGNAFNIQEGVVVDTHVARLSQRLKITRHTNPSKIEEDLMEWIPQPDWAMFSHWLIWHGRRRCYARKPDCPHCEVADLCPSCGKV